MSGPSGNLQKTSQTGSTAGVLKRALEAQEATAKKENVVRQQDKGRNDKEIAKDMGITTGEVKKLSRERQKDVERGSY
jgi:DNA-directed RNA polymerase specialized sigma24 family protein